MTLWTLAEIRAKVKEDLDLEDEVFIDDEEIASKINASIDKAEQIIHTRNEDYLLQSTTLSLVSGTSEYDLPANIYAHKIRKVFYVNGSDRYEVKRIRNLNSIPEIEDADDYRYVVYMTPSGTFKMKLYPASRETSTNITIWYIGNANRLTDDADVMNIPEAVHFVIENTKLECARKEGHPHQVALEAEVMKQEQMMIDSLTAIVVDEDNKVELDMSYYSDQEGCW